MTRLLVSVRTLDEALLAADAGVDLIDVKEPVRGPLGMADPNVLREIGQRLGQEHALSAACGELLDWHTLRTSYDNPADWSGYCFAKIGLAGCAENLRWREEWLAWRRSLPDWVEPVLVCYADGQRCNAPSYDDLLAFAGQVHVRMLLFDTWDKHGPGLCQLWQAADFLRVGQELQQARISFVLAGKLELAVIADLAQYGASYLGIRGAVCDPMKPSEDARCGNLSSAKLKNWKQALKLRTLDKSPHPSSTDL
jgi:uncharacterized protein (UPF0264 family)